MYIRRHTKAFLVTFAGETLRLSGHTPESGSTFLKGVFASSHTVLVVEFRSHSTRFRDRASYTLPLTARSYACEPMKGLYDGRVIVPPIETAPAQAVRWRTADRHPESKEVGSYGNDNHLAAGNS